MKPVTVGGMVLLSIMHATAFAQQSGRDNLSLDIIKDTIIPVIVEEWREYTICEHVDKRGKPSYVENLVPARELRASDEMLSRHFTVQSQDTRSAVDFSLYRIRFASVAMAQRARNHIRKEGTGTVADGKVLTRYAVQVRGAELYVVRTSAMVQPAMQSFLVSFAAPQGH